MHLSNQYDRSSENNSLIKTVFYFIISILIIISSLIILLVSNKNLDTNITKCISNNTKLITSSHNLLLEIGSAQRRVLALALITDKKKQEGIRKKWELAISNSEKHNKAISEYFNRNYSTLTHGAIMKKSQEHRIEYLKSSKKFIQLINLKKDRNIISKFLIYDLGPKFKRYRIMQLELSKMLNEQFLIDSHNITAKASKTVWIVFSIGLFPFVFFGYKLFKGNI